MAVSLKKIHVAKIAVDILWAVKASPRDHTATEENCFDFNRVPLHQYGQYRMIWSQASIYEENHRNLQKGEERNNMHAGWNISAHICCIEADIWLPSNMQTFFYIGDHKATHWTRWKFVR